LGYMHHQRCEMDRRSVRVKLTAKGRDIKDTLSQLFVKHANILATAWICHLSMWIRSPRG
jgi:DNA-binding MarR family transcriptional regulator